MSSRQQIPLSVIVAFGIPAIFFVNAFPLDQAVKILTMAGVCLIHAGFIAEWVYKNSPNYRGIILSGILGGITTGCAVMITDVLPTTWNYFFLGPVAYIALIAIWKTARTQADNGPRR